MKRRLLTVFLILALLLTLFSTTAFAAEVYGTLRVGSKGEDVKTLQTLLNAQGYTLKVDGIFGRGTEGAVKSYQTSQGLRADGIVGSKTWGALLAGRSGSPSAEPGYTILSYGMRGSEVVKLQNLLNQKGASLSADGQFGPKTETAVKSFQAANSITPDGVANTATWEALVSAGSNPIPKPVIPVSGAAGDNLPLKKGMSGDAVKQLQQILTANGFAAPDNGSFDAATEDAVKQYQAAFNLTADGIVGQATWGRMSAVENFIAIAKSKLGSPYVSGGKGPSSFDCSGFVYWCLNQAGIAQKYMTSDMWQDCTTYPKISTMEGLRRGDVISYEGHVGIYLGGGQMIDASSSADEVHINSYNILTSSYWTSHFVCGFRIF
ncbi:MAG: C40 family peptidase [Christensenellales bacterium]